jgi:hypothetical protein
LLTDRIEKSVGGPRRKYSPPSRRRPLLISSRARNHFGLPSSYARTPYLICGHGHHQARARSGSRAIRPAGGRRLSEPADRPALRSSKDRERERKRPEHSEQDRHRLSYPQFAHGSFQKRSTHSRITPIRPLLVVWCRGLQRIPVRGFDPRVTSVTKKRWRLGTLQQSFSLRDRAVAGPLSLIPLGGHRTLHPMDYRRARFTVGGLNGKRRVNKYMLTRHPTIGECIRWSAMIDPTKRYAGHSAH